MVIPLTRPTLPKWENLAPDLSEILASGQLTDGNWVCSFESAVASYLGIRHVVACSSGTTGLMAAMATLPARSCVVMPAYTYIATYQAALWNGLRVLLADCDRSGCIDPYSITSIGSGQNISAIVGVHMHGNACDVDLLERTAHDLGATLIYDSAHAMGSSLFGSPLARFGDISVFSCSPTKPLSLCEGGIIATNDPAAAAGLRLVCHQGHMPGSLSSLRRGLNGRMTEIDACIGCHSLQLLDGWINQRQQLAALYRVLLHDIPGISFQPIRTGCQSSYKDFVVYVDATDYGMDADGLSARLNATYSIQTRRYFSTPLHSMPVYRGDDIELPVTEELARTSLALPMYSHMDEETVVTVCQAVRESSR